MGEVADDMLDGTCCQSCGVWNDDLVKSGEGWQEGDPPRPWSPPGYPWTCPDCKAENAKVRKLRQASREGAGDEHA